MYQNEKLLFIKWIKSKEGYIIKDTIIKSIENYYKTNGEVYI